MKIGIVSDSHDHILNFLKAVDFFNKEKVELVIHCGDWVAPFMMNLLPKLKCKVISVFGNNDGDKVRLLSMGKGVEFHDRLAELELDGRKIAVFHGDPEAIVDALITSGKFDAVFSGHNHKAEIKVHKNTLHLNPGCIAFFWDGTSNPTVGLYDTKTNKGSIVNLG